MSPPGLSTQAVMASKDNQRSERIQSRGSCSSNPTDIACLHELSFLGKQPGSGVCSIVVQLPCKAYTGFVQLSDTWSMSGRASPGCRPGGKPVAWMGAGAALGSAEPAAGLASEAGRIITAGGGCFAAAAAAAALFASSSTVSPMHLVTDLASGCTCRCGQLLKSLLLVNCVPLST